MASHKLYNGRVLVTFNEARHTYSIRIPELNVEKLWVPSVTGQIGIMDKPALIPWAAGQVREYAEMKLKQTAAGAETIAVREVENILAEAQECWRDLSKATSIGSLAHRHLHAELCYRAGVITERPELTLKANTIMAPDLTQEVVDAANLSIKAGLEFLDAHHVEPIFFERVLWHPDHSYIGTVDLIAKVDGVLSALDWKSSKAIYSTMFLQLAAYAAAFMAEFPEQVIVNRIVVNIKKDGTGLETETRGLDTYSEDLGAFLACGDLYRWNRLNDKWRPGSPIQVIGSEFLNSSVAPLTP